MQLSYLKRYLEVISHINYKNFSNGSCEDNFITQLPESKQMTEKRLSLPIVESYFQNLVFCISYTVIRASYKLSVVNKFFLS